MTRLYTCVLFCLLALSTTTWGQTSYVSAVAGNWNTGATWTPNGIPGASDNVTIGATHTITVDANSACNNLTLTIRTSGTSLAIGSYTLEVNGTVASTATSSMSSSIITTSTGRIKFVGTTRDLFSSNWQANPANWRFEVGLNSGQTGTVNTNVKGGDIVISSGTLDMGTRSLSADGGSAGNGTITINSSATLKMGGGNFQRTGTASTGYFSTLTVDGTLEFPSTTVGTINATTFGGTGTVLYSAIGDQTFLKKVTSGGGGDPTTYNNLVISGTGSKTLSINTTVTGTLTMTAGNLALNGNTLTLGTTIAFPGSLAYTAGYVTGTGTFTRWFANGAISGTQGLFPMGVGANNRSLAIGGSPSTGGPIAVSYNDASTVSSITFTENVQNFVNRYDANWVVTPSGGYTDGAMTLTIHGDGIPGITSVADLNVSALTTIATGVWAAPSGTLTAPVLTRNGLTQSTIVTNSFYFASVGSSPLPVEMKSFTATAAGTSALLRWSTATEINNMGFDVQRKSTKSDWAKIGFVAGNGTSNAPHSYTYADNAAAGTYSYRLKQIDRDGKFEYSSVVEVKIALTAADYTLQQNYPNPFNPATVVRFAVPTAQKATLKIYNSAGQEVATLFNGMADAGRMYELSFDGTELASGVYFSILQTSGKQDVKKMTLLR